MATDSLLSVLLLALASGCTGGTVKIPDDTGPSGQHSGEGEGEDSLPTVDTDTGCADPLTWYLDLDGDGYGRTGDTVVACEDPGAFTLTPGDCDDESDAVYPGAAELCNDVDDDCDDELDEGFDADGDGHQSSACADGDDCDDADSSVYTGAEDPCGDGLDSDCDGVDNRCSYETDLGEADAKRYALGRADDAGRHMDVGDVDGDGVGDVVVGAMWADGYQGSAWVVYGPVSGEASFDSTDVELSGGSGSYEGGRTVGVADTNADGYDDILLGAPDAGLYDAVIFFGPVSAAMKFSEADFLGQCGGPVECGHGGDLADVDGDGVGDAVIGAGEEGTGGYHSGSVYLVYGPLSARTLDLQASSDAELIGENPSSETGRVVNAGGDLNGDGIGDILIASSYDSEGGPYAGAVFVVHSPVTEGMDLGDADGKLLGASPYEYAGEGLTMGDLDGDGYAEAIVGAYQSSGGAGNAYAVLGPATGTVTLSDADIQIRGSSAEYFGVSLFSSDVDADGTGDLLAGAGTNSDAGPSAGAAYLFFGPLSGSLSSSDAFTTFTGESPRDGAGYGVGIGDLDGNGLGDILVGAPGNSTGASSAGALFVMLTGG